MFNVSNRQCFLVFLLARICLLMSDNAALAFKIVIIIKNSIIIAKSFDEIYKTIFDHLLAKKSNKIGLFELVSTYFKIIKTNSRDIFYFYYLIWLKSMTNLSNF